jgi:hypothetical protein
MAKVDPAVLAHLEWIGFARPTGLVVSAPALVRAGAILDQRDTEGHRLFASCLTEAPLNGAAIPHIADFQEFASKVLGWSFSPKGYTDSNGSLPSELEVPLPDYGEILRPDLAIREIDPPEGGSKWQLLVRLLGPQEDLDEIAQRDGRLEASEHGRMERLLRETGVPAGLLFNGQTLRLISAPRGESSGWVDFHVADMAQTAGRPILSALRLLLNEQRLLALPKQKRLAALLAESRKFQNEVSERLAEQVLHALYELLRGFQAAHDASGGELLGRVLREQPDEVYRAMLTVILRLVFLLYTEERDMLPEDETFIRAYSISGLYERLREDGALHPDTMEQRYGAWAQLIALFRIIHDGASLGEARLPARRGVLFDPDRYPFLEGRPISARQIHERVSPPLVPDGTVWRVIEDLLVLDGERISYRALDVEQIGSVYETMMGFRLEIASGLSVSIRSQKRFSAPSAVDLEELLGLDGSKRAKWIADRADRKLTATQSRPLTAAETVEDLHAALRPVIDFGATPDLVPKGAMVLQPSLERRRTGSYYTPRTLTQPIVRTTLEPILTRLKVEATSPRPEQILDLKICDPATGSGAFLVEACRQLGDALVESWRAHGDIPSIPSDEDEVVYARRLVAQRCLYGVDRNPVAVDLAKMSLWLVTLAREHPLTFVDHAIRHGDSLVGLTRHQIEASHWDPAAPAVAAHKVRQQIEKVVDLRANIRTAGEETSDWELRDLWHRAQVELDEVRLYGDLVVAAFFEGASPREREAKRAEYTQAIVDGEADKYRHWLEAWRDAEPPLAPFHWDIEFPEVFERENPGFDAFVGNPPFGGKNTVAASNPGDYLGWLKMLHRESHGNADHVAHFFRRTFDLLRDGGTFGLIATNTIAQGDTRATGLRWICTHNGQVYAATKRFKWPGSAAVVVSVVHTIKGNYPGPRKLDGRDAERISAFLFHEGSDEDPARLFANAEKSFVGSYVLGMGFTFDDGDNKGVASPLAEMKRLIAKEARNGEVIFPYIGGEEVNSSPTHSHHRYVINFGERPEEDVRRCWPDLLAIVEERVKPERAKLMNNPIGRKRAKYWWQYGSVAKELYIAIRHLDRVLVISSVGQHAAFAFLPIQTVFSHALIVFALPTNAAFCALQARPHEVWARFLGSSMKDDLRYTPSDCFETYPFPKGWETHAVLEEAGKTYYEFRADLMIRNDEGLTKIYNRFHDPNEQDADILKLRELHAAMDRAVLDAYGWSDVPTGCDFFLDYEIDEEEWGDKKKPWRYRWPDEVRDQVLARLLALNRVRAEAEARAGMTRTRRRSSPPQPNEALFE